jgi:hypothetical protein
MSKEQKSVTIQRSLSFRAERGILKRWEHQ